MFPDRPLRARLVNNLFIGPGVVLEGQGAQTTNLATRKARLANQAEYNYHLSKDCLAIAMLERRQAAPLGYDLTPQYEYVHPLGARPRAVVGPAIDIGAYEYNPE